MAADFNHFGNIIEALTVGVPAANEEIANAAVGHIKDHITANNQIVTGNMLDSVHAEVQSDGSQNVLVDAKNKDGEYYAAYPNYGTRYQPSNPFFEPGLEDTQEDMDTAMAALVASIEAAAAG